VLFLSIISSTCYLQCLFVSLDTQLRVVLFEGKVSQVEQCNELDFLVRYLLTDLSRTQILRLSPFEIVLSLEHNPYGIENVPLTIVKGGLTRTLQSTPQAKRPGLVIVVVALYLINMLFGLFTGILLITSGDPGVLPIGATVITIAVLELIFSIGLWMLRRWARWMAIIISILVIPIGIIGILMSGGRDPGTYLGIVAAVVALVGLFQPQIRSLFT
jgi:hypothetical protein